jgi:energy-coupling factor transporter ATP-binding protein EcfA2
MARNPLLLPFREAYRNLSLDPLSTQEEIERFGVEYDLDTLERLQQEIEDSPREESKIIFTGHRGCGKSTLLASIKTRLEEEEFFVVFFSISDLIEMSDVNHVNILFALAVQLMEEAESQKIPIKASIKKNFYQWFAEETKTSIEEFGAEVEGGFNFSSLLAWVKGKLRNSAVERKEIKQKYERNISELVNRVHQIATVVEETADKEIVVIIDDIDKLDMRTVWDIFHLNVKALFQPNLRMVMTLPIAALREGNLMAALQTETGNKIISMSVPKLFPKSQKRNLDAEPNPQLMATFQELLFKRMLPELLESRAIQEIVIYSGGVLRELIRITSQCCRICLLQVRREPENQEIKITIETVQQAIKELRLDFELPLGAVDYQILGEVKNNFIPEDPKAQNFLNLLHSLHILEYRNSEIWYDLHPIIMELPERRELSTT